MKRVTLRYARSNIANQVEIDTKEEAKINDPKVIIGTETNATYKIKSAVTVRGLVTSLRTATLKRIKNEKTKNRTRTTSRPLIVENLINVIKRHFDPKPHTAIWKNAKQT
jgi:uncharacterized protein with NRDE domain